MTALFDKWIAVKMGEKRELMVRVIDVKEMVEELKRWQPYYFESPDGTCETCHYAFNLIYNIDIGSNVERSLCQECLYREVFGSVKE